MNLKVWDQLVENIKLFVPHKPKTSTKTQYFLGILKLIIEHGFKSIENIAVMRDSVKSLKTVKDNTQSTFYIEFVSP